MTADWLRKLADEADRDRLTNEASWLEIKAPDLARWAHRIAGIVEEMAQGTRDPIDQNYIAILRDDWEILNAAVARLEALQPKETP